MFVESRRNYKLMDIKKQIEIETQLLMMLTNRK